MLWLGQHIFVLLFTNSIYCGISQPAIKLSVYVTIISGANDCKVPVLQGQQWVRFPPHFMFCHKYSHLSLSLRFFLSLSLSLSWWNLWEVRKFSQLFQPSQKRFCGTERHAAATSSEPKSFQNDNFPPFSASRLPITTLSALWKILGGGIASYKVCIKQIYHGARWLAGTGAGVQ